jgi:hypothetical protein
VEEQSGEGATLRFTLPVLPLGTAERAG